jgi:D-alanine--poly(phosphoribitol) ligase subunit 1
VFDFYASLFTGASILPISESVTIQPRKLLNELNRLQPTIWFSVPSMLVYVLNTRALKPDDLPTLRVVTFGGEGFPKNKLRELWKFWGQRIRFINVYGPTECTCICSSYLVTESDLSNDDLLPLGPMAPNFTAFIMAEDGSLMENGETGELCLGGPNVGLGYFNNPGKTTEAFIDNPTVRSHKEKIYKTGDLVAYDSEKNIFLFKGRKDNQIKRMGYRIELEEIENALNSLELIEESAVVFVDNASYKSKIIACIKSKERDVQRIQSHLGNHLPLYMMPDIMEFYDQLPKNQNGKIDRINLKNSFSS